MKRYYTSFIRYRLIMILMPIVFTFNGILNSLNLRETDDFLGTISPYLNIANFIIVGFSLVHLYRIYKKMVYIEVNQESIVYSYGKRKIVYEYNDALHYIIKPGGKFRNLYVKSIKKGKKIRIPLSYFDVGYDEFIILLSDYSGKEVYYKDYGEEPVLLK